MTYTQLFQASNLDLLAQGIKDELETLGQEVVNAALAGAQTTGQALQALGTALQQQPSPRAQAWGDALEKVGLALDTGSKLYLDGISPETVGRIFSDVAAGSFTGLLIPAALAVAAEAAFAALGIQPLLYAGLFALTPLGIGFTIGALGAALYFGDPYITAPLSNWLYDHLMSPLIGLIRDPLVLDLDGDGVELGGLADSSVHFDYDQDGFAEKTGWVSADDAILVRDSNTNGTVDGASELFGSPNQDGFAVLEAMDTNGDGTIDAKDEGFDQLRVWQDLDQDGISDAGELRTLSEAGIKSISVIRSDIGGTNQGHPIGYEASFERSDGTSGTAQTIYFETDRQNTVSDNTPGFTPSTEATQLPQLQGSGQINSIAWMVTTDLAFRDAWTELTDNAATLSFDELRGNFMELLLRWADVDDVAEAGRGKFVNGQHLAFVEKFFGTTYREIYSGDVVATSPTNSTFGSNIEASFSQVVDALLTAFLAQTSTSAVLRGAGLADVLASPYFAFALLDLSADEGGEAPSAEASQGSVKAALSIILGLMPDEPGAAAKFLQAGLTGLNGVVSLVFDGDRNAFISSAADALNTIENPVLHAIATEIIKGTALVGSSGIDGLYQDEGDNVFMGGKGDDVIVSGDGSDLFVYASGDGSDYIRDTSVSTTEHDQLFLTDLQLTDLIFERVGNALVIKFASSDETIISEDFFRDWGVKGRGIDSIRLSDGTILSREQIRELATTAGDGRNNSLSDTALNDILRGGQGDDEINISGGSDTVVYAKGDGDDVIRAGSDSNADFDTLLLAGLRSSDVELSRAGNALIVSIKLTGEFLTDADFFRTSTGLAGNGIDRIQFADGLLWDRDAIREAAWIRGNSDVNGLDGFTTSDVFVGSAGADTLQGRLGSDTYRWSKGDGNDTIIESADVASQDRLLLLDVKPGEVELMRRGTSLLVSIKSTGEVLEIARQFESVDNVLEDWNSHSYGLEAIEFGNGVQWSRQYLMANIVNVGFDLDVSYWFRLVGTDEPPFPVDDLDEISSGGGGGSTSTLPLLGISFEDELGHSGNFFDIEEIVRNYERLDRGGNDIFLGDE
ncbi:MAG TPA: calcium-binding protein, partial [Clostridia bacterium]|nr:calcium-binding protein [Clostridia bacterium]